MPLDTQDNINDYYESQHFEQQDSIIAEIKRYYDEIIRKVSPLIAADAPIQAINKKLDQLLTAMVKRTVSAIQTGMQKSWTISLKKTGDMVELQYKGIELPKPIKAALDDKRASALKTFIARKDNGLNLSDRIYKNSDQFKQLINDEISTGFPEGKSAVKVARKLREALKRNDKQDKPGQGVYKSPVKNTERTARTEINMAYRKADDISWKNNPLVLGFEIKLSATSKPKARCELCRTLEGKYPVTFVWVGWHPHCLCFKIPILMSREMLNAYNRLIARGEDTPEAVTKLQKGVRLANLPDQLTKWVQDNQERVEGWKSKPYWWRDNEKAINYLLKQR